MSTIDPAALYESIQGEASDVIIGNEDVIEALTVALLSNGNVLLEGVPGVAKTTMASVFANTMGLSDSRIQMTPDLLPADITGSHIYREETNEFVIQRGPVFSNLVIADEINRATPKTQSALLEAMQEKQVTIEGDTQSLPTPFMVVATQNPIEMEGTFPLPQAQRDRFLFKLTVELPDHDEERSLLDRIDTTPDLMSQTVQQVVSPGDIMSAREQTTAVHIAEPVREYILEIVAESRAHPALEHGASPRATIAFVTASKSRALIHGRDYVIPDDIISYAKPILRHRLLLGSEADLRDESVSDIIDDILDAVETPSEELNLAGGT